MTDWLFPTFTSLNLVGGPLEVTRLIEESLKSVFIKKRKYLRFNDSIPAIWLRIQNPQHVIHLILKPGLPIFGGFANSILEDASS